MTDHIPNDDDELELEPVDPEILKLQQERTKRQQREAEDAVDINAVFDQEDLGDPFDIERLKQFRFNTRHLLIITALLAMVMTLFIKLESNCMGLFVTGCCALGAGWWFVLREERRRLAEIAKRREQYAAQLAARRAAEDGEPIPEPKPALKSEEFQQTSSQWQMENEAQSSFKFSFSMKELLVAFTIAALFLGMTQFIGGPQNAALLLGLIALGGLVLQATGADMPPMVVLSWWILMVLYIVVSIWATLSPAA